MAVLDLVIYPNDVLYKNCDKVEVFDEELKTLVSNMFETMHMHEGIGLAAPQVGVTKQIFIMDIPDVTNGPLVFINSVLVSLGNEKIKFEEGCLSFPELFVEIERLSSLVVKAQNVDGSEFQLALIGIAAICAQHEMDHLRGKLFIENLSTFKRGRAMTKFGKMQKTKS